MRHFTISGLSLVCQLPIGNITLKDMNINTKHVAFALLLVLIPAVIFAQWSTDPAGNTVVRNTEGLLSVPHIAATSSGNNYISWYSATEELRFDVYLQYFDVNGHKLWSEDGLLISDHPTFTWVSDYGLAVDKEGYAVLAFQDKRDGFSNAFAYRISPEGEFSWGANGIRLTDDPAYDWWPQVLVTDDNDFIFTYTIEPIDTTQSWKIGLQKMDAEGNRLWGENILTGFEMDYFLPQMLLTEEGNLMVSWMAKTSLPDTVVGQQNWMHVYLQKFGPDGLPLWSEPVQADIGDLMAFNAAYIVPYLANNGTDGAYVIWQSFFLENPTIRVNNVRADGQLLWQENGVQVETNIMQESQQPSVLYDPMEDRLSVFFLVYQYDGIHQLDCWAVGGQKFSPSGERLWGEHAKLIVPMVCSIDTTFIATLVKPAPDNGMCVFFEEKYDAISESDTIHNTVLYASLLDSEGNFVWPNEKIPVSTALGLKTYYTAGDYSADQWITAWSDNRDHPHQIYYTDVYAQNVTISGTIGPLSVDDHPDTWAQSLSCYPNPFTEKITVTCETDISGAVILTMRDARGRTVLTQSISSQGTGHFNHEIDAYSLSPGFYFLELRAGDEFFREKVVKR